MSEDYTKVIGYLKDIKPQGKAVYYVGGKWVEADYNFSPPKIRKIEVDTPEIKEKEEEE